MIHLGNVLGANLGISPKDVWRVNNDGKICDTYRTLRYAFEMEETDFFSHYVSDEYEKDTSNFELWKQKYKELYNSINSR